MQALSCQRKIANVDYLEDAFDGRKVIGRCYTTPVIRQQSLALGENADPQNVHLVTWLSGWAYHEIASRVALHHRIDKHTNCWGWDEFHLQPAVGPS